MADINPRWFSLRVFRWFCDPEFVDDIEGDLLERYASRAEEHGEKYAKKRLNRDVFQLFRPGIIRPLGIREKLEFLGLRSVHFRYSTRILQKNALISAASMASLVLGVLSTLLIFLWVQSEWSADKFHGNYDYLYVPVIQQSPLDEYRPMNMSYILKTNYDTFPEIEEHMEVLYFEPEEYNIVLNNMEFPGTGLVVDKDFLDILNFEIKTTQGPDILHDSTKIMLTESFAKQIFGEGDPLGKSLELADVGTYEVGAILEDTPSNSSIYFDYVAPRHHYDRRKDSGVEFILATPSFDLDTFNQKIKHAGKDHPQFTESIVSLVPFKDLYFDLDLETGIFANQGDRQDVITMMIVAIVIMIVSIMNFTNMQSTLFISTINSKVIKHVLGARRVDLFSELLASRIIYGVIGSSIVFTLYLALESDYLSFLGLTQPASKIGVLLLILIGCTIFLGISIQFSLWQASRTDDYKILKNRSLANKSHKGHLWTTAQNILAVVLIVASMVIYKQFIYMQDKDLGFDSDDIISIKFFDEIIYESDDTLFYLQNRDQQKAYLGFKEELDKIPGIKHYTQGEGPLAGVLMDHPWKNLAGESEYDDINTRVVDPNYLKTFDLEMAEGEFFSFSKHKQRGNQVVINEAAMKYWGIQDLSNAKIRMRYWADDTKSYDVIGVVKDYHYEHLSRNIEPLVMIWFEDRYRTFSFKLDEESTDETIATLEGLYQDINPGGSMNYSVLNDVIRAQYNHEEKQTQAIIVFTFVALLISSLGLFTFALYDTRKRIKEIGIRKVLGASTVQILSLLSNSYIKWVMWAVIIATPLAFILMRQWLSNFANQTELSWWIFGGSGLLAIFLAQLTVLGQSYKAANQNPVKALRHD